jgi:hypothetical protein
MTHEHHDRDTVVVRDGGSGLGAILGIVALIIILAAAWYFLLGPGTGRSETDRSNGGSGNQAVPSLALPTAGAS